MQEPSITTNGSLNQQVSPARSLLGRVFTVLLPLLTIVIVGGSLFGLQWVGQHALTLGYPVPHAQINGPTGPLTRLQSYQFTSTGTGRDLTYTWDFGDQSTDSGSTVSHAYQQDGSFTVTLTATDPTGQTAMQTYTVTVKPSPPNASFTFYAYSFGHYVSFNAYNSTADPSTSIYSYKWTFGDGTSNTTYYGSESHYYSAAGTYQVTLVVTDTTGQSSTPYSLSVTVP